MTAPGAVVATHCGTCGTGGIRSRGANSARTMSAGKVAPVHPPKEGGGAGGGTEIDGYDHAEAASVFRKYYLEKCTQLGIKRSEEVMRFLTEAEVGIAFMGKLAISSALGPLGAKGCIALCYALSYNYTIHTVDIRGHQIGDEGARNVALLLRQNFTIRTLMLDGNEIGSVGGFALGDALSSNRSLTTLSLRNNPLGQSAGAAVLRALVDTSVVQIDLGNTGLNQDIYPVLGDLLELNATLQAISLSQNRLGDKLIDRIAVPLRINTAIRFLDLSNTSMSHHGGMLLKRALEDNVSLTRLDLSFNTVGTATVQSIQEILLRNAGRSAARAVSAAALSLGDGTVGSAAAPPAAGSGGAAATAAMYGSAVSAVGAGSAASGAGAGVSAAGGGSGMSAGAAAAVGAGSGVEGAAGDRPASAFVARPIRAEDTSASPAAALRAHNDGLQLQIRRSIALSSPDRALRGSPAVSAAGGALGTTAGPAPAPASVPAAWGALASASSGSLGGAAGDGAVAGDGDEGEPGEDLPYTENVEYPAFVSPRAGEGSSSSPASGGTTSLGRAVARLASLVVLLADGEPNDLPKLLEMLQKHRRYLERIDAAADRSRTGVIKSLISMAVYELERLQKLLSARETEAAQKIDRLQQALDTEHEALISLRATLSEKDTVLDEMEKQCSLAVETITSMRTSEARREGQLKALEREKDFLSRENAQLRDERTRLHHELQVLTQQNTELTATVQKSQSQFADQSRKLLEMQDTGSQRVQELSEALRAAKTECEVLRDALLGKDSAHRTEVAALRDNVRQLEARLADMEQETQRQRQVIVSTEQKMEDLQRRLAASEQQRSVLLIENERLNRKTSQSHETVRILAEKLEHSTRGLDGRGRSPGRQPARTASDAMLSPR